MEKDDIINKIKEVIETIKPYLYFEGGDIEFVKYEDNYVYVKMLGNCQNCMYMGDTIENGILQSLKNEIPEIKGVINIPL